MKQLNKLLDTIANNKKSHFGLFLCILIVLTLVMMYCYSPLYPGQDFFFHYRRLQALMDGMKNSPYFIYLDYGAIDGYGYFAKAFYSDFVLIPFALIGNVTSLQFAYQFMIFSMTILCGIFTYKAVCRVYKKSYVAVIGSLLFTFALYRLLDIYHRAALGEALSFTFIPLVFWGLYEIIKGDYKKWYILTIGYSLMIFTHVISSVLMFITLIIFLFIYYKSFLKEPKRFFYLILSALVTFFVVGYYLYPMLEQMLSGSFYYSSRQIMDKAQDTARDLHWVIWGMFSGIVHPKQIFVPGIGLLLTGVICLRLFVYEKSSQLKGIDTIVLLGLIYILASSSLFPWSLFPFNLLNFIQLPWRLYEFSSLFFAVAGGYYLYQILKTNKRLFIGGCLIVLGIILVMVNDGKLYQDVYSSRTIAEESSLGNNYHLGGLEYVPSKVSSIEYIAQRGDSIGRQHDETNISDFKRNKGITSFNISTSNKEVLELPLLYYKGYKAKLDNEDILVSESNNGLVEISLEKSGRVEVYYDGTIVQKISFYITIVSIFALCIYIFLQQKKKFYNKQNNGTF